MITLTFLILSIAVNVLLALAWVKQSNRAEWAEVQTNRVLDLVNEDNHHELRQKIYNKLGRL